jgi:hypothetical protein
VLVQRDQVTRGIEVTAGSFAAVAATAVDVLAVQGASYVQTCGTTAGQVNVAAGATVENFAGAMPQVQVPELISLGTPIPISYTGEPNGLFLVFGDLQVGFLSLIGTFIELPGLLGYVGHVTITVGITDPTGGAAISPVFTNNPMFLGLPIYLQAVHLNMSGSLRLSNLEFTALVQ